MNAPIPNRAWRLGVAVCILAAVTYGVLPAIIDTFDPAHLRNPLWPPHARLHLMWLISAGLYQSLFGIYLFATATPQTFDRVKFGAAIGGLHIAGFFTAGLFKGAVGAAFDADGRTLFGVVPPAILHLSTSLALLAAGYTLCQREARAARSRGEVA